MAIHEATRWTRHAGIAPLALTALLAAPWAGEASTVITVDDLPGALQPYFPAAIAPVSSFDANGATAFHFLDTTTLSEKWLVRYPLLPGSVQTITDNDTGATDQTPLTGYLWLEAPAVLDPGHEPQQFTVYTDKVSPAPLVLWPWVASGTDTDLGLPAFDVASSGGGFFVAGLDWDLESYLSGSLRILDADGTPNVPFCLAEGCESSATLQLTYLNYTSGTVTFDAADPHALVFAQQAIDPYSQTVTQKYYVQVVPEPTSAVVVVAACACVGWWRNRQKR